MTYPHSGDEGDPNFDWTRGQPTGTSEADIDNMTFGEVAFGKDADEIEAARARKEPPPGDHEFFVAGFWKAPEAVARTGYLNGQLVSWTAYKVGVRFALVSDPAATAMDFFDLPPNAPHEVQYYLNASTKSEGKNPGFMAEKFGHFVSRLGWPYPKGAPIPAEARRLGNWKNRRIVCTIEHQVEKDPHTGQAKLNPTTGEPYPPKAAIKLFSYRPAGATLGQPMGSPGQRPTMGHPAPPAPPSPPLGYPSGGMGAPVATAPMGQPAGQPVVNADRLAAMRGQL